jgi:hypothetical protein
VEIITEELIIKTLIDPEFISVYMNYMCFIKNFNGNVLLVQTVRNNGIDEIFYVNWLINMTHQRNILLN